jgi:hypothetical protein
MAGPLRQVAALGGRQEGRDMTDRQILRHSHKSLTRIGIPSGT